jgi:hypothetical protein
VVSCFSHTQKLLECRINTRGKVSALYGPAHLKKKNGGKRIGLHRGKKKFLSRDTRLVVCVCRAYRSSSSIQNKNKNRVGGVFVCVGDTLPFAVKPIIRPCLSFFE